MRRLVKLKDKVEACDICRHHRMPKPWSPDLFVLFLYTDFRESCFMLPRELQLEDPTAVLLAQPTAKKPTYYD